MTPKRMAELSGFNKAYTDNLIRNLNRNADLETAAKRQAATAELEKYLGKTAAQTTASDRNQAS